MSTTKTTIDPQAIRDTVAAVEENPALAQVTFQVNSEWIGRFQARSATGPFEQAGAPDSTRSRTYEFESDEPVALLGDDAAASPGEYVLQALAACYAVTFAANAAVLGIELEKLHLELRGEFDLHGFLGMDKSVRSGMQGLDVAVRIDSPNATRQQLGDLVRTVEERSPIRDTIANAVPVRTTMVD